jgi:hypothetical protein
MKKILISTVALSVLWCALDFVVHGILLQDLYMTTPQLWRPMEEIQQSYWMHLITLAGAALFSWMYRDNVRGNSPKDGLSFGAKFGAVVGLWMGGMYAVMPISLELGLAWFLSSFINLSLGGLVAALIFKR